MRTGSCAGPCTVFETAMARASVAARITLTPASTHQWGLRSSTIVSLSLSSRRGNGIRGPY